MKSRLVVVGAGGHGLVVAEAAESMGAWREIVFLDDGRVTTGDVAGFELLGATGDLKKVCGDDGEFVVGVGDNRTRRELFEQGVAAGVRGAVVCHSQSVVSARAILEPGVVILANAIVAARTIVGTTALVNHAATVDHDCRIGVAAHVAPGAHIAAGVVVLEEAWIGLGATVNSGVTVGANAFVGASAAVIADVEAGATVVGVPARTRE